MLLLLLIGPLAASADDREASRNVSVGESAALFSRLCTGRNFSAVMPRFPVQTATAFVVHDMSAGPAPEPRVGPLCALRRLLGSAPPQCYRYYVGRYDEHRPAVYATDHFADAGYAIDGYDGIRNIHIGLDLGAPAGTPVHAPCDGIIHSFGYNPAEGDYGHVVVTEHRLDDLDFWLLYGHLSASSSAFKQVGSKVRAGDQVGAVGKRHENGHWPEHLHFQVSLLRPSGHDMPGVVSAAQRARAVQEYPDPRLILGPLY